jgi:hypothetical protein
MIDVTDITNRPAVTTGIKNAIKLAFAEVPEGKSSALIAIYDYNAQAARLHFAWKANNVWKVGAQVGWSKEDSLSAAVGVEAAW